MQYVSRNEKMRENAQEQECRQMKDANSPTVMAGVNKDNLTENKSLWTCHGL